MNVTIPYTPRKQQAFIHTELDNKRFSVGIHGISGKLNASAIINSGWQSSVFWNGRANSLEDQALES